MSAPHAILVTGSAGFIGSSLVDRLLAEGRQVTGFDSFDAFYAEEQKLENLRAAREATGFRLVRGDIRDAEAVERLFRQADFEAVVHLAALAGVRASIERPARYAEVNVSGTAVLMEAAARHGRPRLVFASSSSVYGERSDGPFRESDPVAEPKSPYAATKRAGELLAQVFHETHGLSVTCARIFTTYGPRQRPDLAIRRFAECMLAGRAVPIFGDGSTLRDFTYIDDLVDGLARAVDRDLGFAIVNLGTGHKVSVREMVKVLERALALPARLEWLPAQAGDVTRTWADISRARERLGYAPAVAFEEGIGRFAQWLGRGER